MMLHPAVKNLLEVYAFRAAPHEAVGLIDGGGNIFVLENNAENPEDSFVIDKQQIARVMDKANFVFGDITLWHSHPSGGVGPSRTDMQQKTPFKYHLVVTIIEDGIELTYY